jgi:hypothetical protein
MPCGFTGHQARTNPEILFSLSYIPMSFSMGAAISAGIISGIIATVVQMALWWLFQEPLPETLYRDARLAAAILMGAEVLPPPASLNWKVMIVATFIHFLISIGYSIILAYLISRLGMPFSLFSLFVGAIFGAFVYVVNMYGFTVIFPWFSMVRDWITFFTHIAFGISLAGIYHLLARHGL